jgi:gas vesicle protein
MADTTTAPPGTSAPPPGDTSQSQSKAQEAASQATDKAQEVAGQAKDKAQEAAGQAKGRVRDQVDERSTQAGEQVSTTASDIRNVGEQLREQGKDGPAKLAEQAADRAERVGSYLTESSADRILSDVEDFARKQPWAVVAGGLALGFAGSRFLKASSTQRYRQRSLADAPTQPYATPRGDREIGGPTAAPGGGGIATGGATGTHPTGLDPHR